MPDRLFAATRKGLFELRGGAGAWQVAATAFLGSPVSMVMTDPRDGALYAALDLGHFGVKLHRSDDGGANWQEVGVPSYAGVVGDGPEPPSLKLLWALEAGGADEPGALWAGTIPGGLFRSEDRGESWTLVRSLWDDPRRGAWMGGGYDHPGIHSICIDPRDSRRLALGVSCGGVWESFDRGESWVLGGEGMRAEYLPPDQAGEPETQDPHRLVQCRSAPDEYWVQHHNGIFRSVGGVAKWREIHPPHSGFGFAVVVHPQNPARAWFVPAVKDEYRYPEGGRLQVARTSDSGESFEFFSAGLPQTHAYDLVYRHGLVVDATGENLAMASTTGGLWSSSDSGESWVAAPVRLPPVYALHLG